VQKVCFYHKEIASHFSDVFWSDQKEWIGDGVETRRTIGKRLAKVNFLRGPRIGVGAEMGVPITFASADSCANEVDVNFGGGGRNGEGSGYVENGAGYRAGEGDVAS